MWRPGGYALTIEADGRRVEVDTFTCLHCQRVVEVPPKQRPEDMGGFCRLCAGPVCAGCHATGSCTPFERRLAAIEARDIARRSYGF